MNWEFKKGWKKKSKGKSLSTRSITPSLRGRLNDERERKKKKGKNKTKLTKFGEIERLYTDGAHNKSTA